MSGQATGWVLRHGPCTAWAAGLGCRKDRSGQAVLTAIADAANRDGANAHPGIAAMEDASGYARATVFDALTRLERSGWVEVTDPGGGRGKATVYRIPGVTDPTWRPAQTVQPLDPQTVQAPDPGTIQPPDGSDDGNGPDENAKGSSSDPETVQMSDSAPITQRFSNGREQHAASTDVPTFDDFWATVPNGRRVGKRDALAAWNAAVKRASPAEIVEGMRRYADETRGKDIQYVKHPAPWLRADRWLDEPGANRDRQTRPNRRPIQTDRTRPSGRIRDEDL